MAQQVVADAIAADGGKAGVALSEANGAIATTKAARNKTS